MDNDFAITLKAISLSNTLKSCPDDKYDVFNKSIHDLFRLVRQLISYLSKFFVHLRLN